MPSRWAGGDRVASNSGTNAIAAACVAQLRTLPAAIRTLGCWIDFAFRKIFGKPGNEICLICLISLLNAVLQLPHPVVSVEYLNPFGYKDFETDNLVCVDVKATDQLGRVFVIEVQIVVHSSFAKRAVFYACEAYTDQLRAGQGYSNLKATYSICL